MTTATKPRRKCILITGMHRCGTSAVAGTLGLLGAGMPKHLVPPNPSNTKGHFEAETLVALNDAAFSSEGLTWYNCEDPALDDDAALERRAAEIVATVEAEYGAGDQPIVVKDPRTARLGRLWRRAAELGDWDVGAIVMHRKAAAVTDSLARRNGWTPVRSVWLWLAHMAGAERLTEGYPRVFLDADAFVGDPVGTAERLQGALGLTWPKAPAEAAAEIATFVERGMLAREAEQDLPWAEVVAEVEEALQTLAADPGDAGALDALRAVGGVTSTSGRYIEDAARASESYMAAFRQEQATREQVMGELNELIDAHAALEKDPGRLTQAVTRLETKLAKSDEALAKLERELAEALNALRLKDESARRRESDLRHAAEWITQKAENAERRPLRTTLRRVGYGIAKGAAKAPGGFGRGASKLVEKHSPKRFREKLNEALALSLSKGQAVARLEAMASAGGRSTYAPLTAEAPPTTSAATVVAFFLPQYHPIPENDRWWGRGFTEWTNVTRAVPQFEDHYQPHRPGELGYYDLRLPQVQERQAELAKLHGIGAFCYYFYWFAGHRLLETPLLAMLDNPNIDLPFCLCWANENWTRTWDGLSDEVLIGQDHSPEDDLAFISYIARYLRDPRYLRVDGKPVLLVYRPSLLPDMAETAGRWRNWCRENGIGEIHLCMTQSFDSADPAVYGLDATVEFPPNNTAPPELTDRLVPFDADYSGQVFDWTIYPERARSYKTPEALTYRGVCTSWDNTARRGAAGKWFRGATPAGLSDWLTSAMRDTIRRIDEPSGRLVFINAWNEWAEGAHLEPDEKYGYAWLDAVREAHTRAIGAGSASPLTEPLAIVVHDAHRHGAQYLALALARTARARFRSEVNLVVLGDGELMDEFHSAAQVHRPDPNLPPAEAAEAIAERLVQAGVRHAVVNSVASGSVVRPFHKAGLHQSVLVHEMPDLIRRHELEDAARDIAELADQIIFPAEIVRAGFAGLTDLAPERTVIRPQGMFKPPAPGDPNERQRRRRAKRAELELSEEAYLVIAAGYGDHRKGIDLFVEAAIDICRSDPEAVFIWIGILHHDYTESIPAQVEAAGLSDRILFPGFVQPLTDMMLAADLFVLSSREDPFPSVMLDAMDAGLAVVAVADTGGCADMLARGYGRLAASPTAEALAAEIRALRAPETRAPYIDRSRQLVAREFSFPRYAYDVISQEGARAPRVSVILPSYNYVDFIEERVRSIAEQTWPLYEFIVLDDASTDGTAEWLDENLAEIWPGAVLDLSKENSGSVFRQWRRGLEMAQGDLVWVAEADDACDPAMLAHLVAAFDDPATTMAYCQSRAVGEDGRLIMTDYTEWTADIDPALWASSFVADSHTALRQQFAVKNVVPNVSAALFRRSALMAALETIGDELEDWKVAGDWRIYAALLSQGGKIAFEAKALNVHRRHETSVTHALKQEAHFGEIVRMQEMIANDYELDEDTARRAAAFQDSVRGHLGL